jgi:hypothetical protein
MRKALHDAATSLETISLTAGSGEFMETHMEVRGYANSRARAAREALAGWRPHAAAAPVASEGDSLVPAACIGRDPACPCPDGDPCHYVDAGGTKAWPIPAQPAEPKERKPLTDDEIDALDTFALHVLAPLGRESVRQFARAIESARESKE